MEHFWQWALSVLGSGAFALALMRIAGYLGRSQLDHLLAKNIEVLKAEHQRDLELVKTELSKSIEITKSDLQRLSNEHSVKFQKLHEHRAAVISRLYSLLVRTLWAADSFLSPMEFAGEPSKKEKAVAAQNSIARTFRYFDRHRIYLPEDVCNSFDALIREVRSQVIHFNVYIRFDDDFINEHTAQAKMDAWTKSYTVLTEKIPAARRLLEMEFRGLLGEPAPETGETGALTSKKS
ncbi:hypothetical protein [Variovorax sp. efr-133-TYG-130]|uniref:hypothetical protein n=1 Tax=Variovorax sp. efr-133-TYG-130 TaxID=3040327 RepID=UPI0025537E2B|nr:hypothetical protein [Variovorax sp. efr-133-TYG-130]